MQVGLKPDEVLDMSLDVFKACIQGYADHVFDLQVLTVQQGYWSGYYQNSKHPKSMSFIIQSMIRHHQKAKTPTSRSSVPEVDVNSFLNTERQFWERMHQEGGESVGRHN